MAKKKTNRENNRSANGEDAGQIRGMLVDLITNNRDKLQEDFLFLDSNKRLELATKILPYILPKADGAPPKPVTDDYDDVWSELFH